MNRIKYIRVVIAQATQIAFAEAIGMAQGTISRWENDDSCPTLDDAAKIMAAYPSVQPVHFFADPATYTPKAP